MDKTAGEKSVHAADDLGAAKVHPLRDAAIRVIPRR
jgi:hypothetical protein